MKLKSWWILLLVFAGLPYMVDAGCSSIDIHMFCFRHTFRARDFVRTPFYHQASKNCFPHLTGGRSCEVTEPELHRQFLQSSGKTDYIKRSAKLVFKCQNCLQDKRLIAGVTTPSPTPQSDYVSECEKKCATKVNIKYKSSEFEKICGNPSITGGDVCAYYSHKQGSLPHSWSTNFQDVMAPLQDSCFCLRHCSIDSMKVSCDSKGRSTAETAVIRADPSVQNCAWASMAIAGKYCSAKEKAEKLYSHMMHSESEQHKIPTPEVEKAVVPSCSGKKGTVYGDWTKCDATCGVGKQSRWKVTCGSFFFKMKQTKQCAELMGCT